jgi:hypothetical protein
MQELPAARDVVQFPVLVAPLINIDTSQESTVHSTKVGIANIVDLVMVIIDIDPRVTLSPKVTSTSI